MGLESHIPSARKYSPLPGEIETIRKQAIESGRDPEEAVGAFLERMNMANARLEEDIKDVHNSAPRFALSSKTEIEKVRDMALASGQDPNKAIADYLRKFEIENERLEEERRRGKVA